jgi:hypothetical protein
LDTQNEELFKKNPDEQPKTAENENVMEEPEKKEPPEDPEDKNPAEKPEDKKKYDLEEVVEYQELKTQFEELQSQYSVLEGEKTALEAQVATLNEFKLATERKDKQNMIDSFYMLSDEDKQDVVSNIDSYSLDDIEAKLSVICFRNKVNFNLDDESSSNNLTFNLQENVADNDTAPDWVKAARELNK